MAAICQVTSSLSWEAVVGEAVVGHFDEFHKIGMAGVPFHSFLQNSGASVAYLG